MAKEIDQLNYKVIFDDKEFDAKIKADLKLAKDFNIQMSQLLDIKNKASSADVKAATNAERIAREQLKTQQMLAREQSKTAAAQVKAQEQIRREQQKTSSQAVINSEKEQRAMTQTLTAQERLNKMKQAGNTHYGTQNRLLRELAGYGAAYFSVRTVERFISSLVRVSGEFELQHRTLQAIVGDIDAADKIFNQLQVLAVKSPFSFSQLTSYTKQLSAFSIPTEELYETTKMLADVSAGLGVDMGRIILAYGQIRSAAFLRGQEVRQLTEAGIPILTELAKQFTEIEGRMISAGEVFDKISMREVPFEMVEQVFKNMTSEGGKFYNMQEIQAETLKAKVKNLGDQYDIMLYQIGQAQDGLLKGSVTAIGNLMEHWQAIGRVIVSVASGFGVYAAVLATIAVRKKALAALDTVRLIGMEIQATKSLTAGLRAYRDMVVQAGAATKAAFAASIIGIIAAIAVEIAQLVRSAGELNRELNKIANTKFSESSDTIRGLDTLVKKLESATEGSQNYRDAIHELNRRYGDYLPNLITERDTLDEIRIAADAAAESIRNKAQASALAEGKEKIVEKYGKSLNERQSAIINNLRALIPSATEKDAANIFNLFKDILDSGETDSYQAIRRAIDAYIDPGKDFWERQGKNAAKNPLWGNVGRYAKTLREWDEEIEKYNEKLGIVFSDYTPQSKHEQETLSAIDAYYTEQEQAIRHMQASEEEVNKMLKDLKIRRLENEILFYSGQGITLGDKAIADGVLREEIAKKKRAELAKLTVKPTKGARLVQEALAGQGITERNKAWGLWADETTDFSADGYYKTLDEQYKEIEPNIKRARERFLSIAGLPFEKADIKKLNAEAQSAYNDIVTYNKRKEAIIAIAEKLGYDLGDATAKKGGSGEDPRLKALKLRQQRIEEIRKQYEAFKPFMNKSDDTTIKGILFGEAGLFPEETDEALKSTLDFDAALMRVAEDMEKYGEKGAEAARKIREEVELAAAKAKAEELLKSYKDSATALEKVQGILDKIAENIKDVNGENLQLKVNVVRDDLDRKNRKVDAEATEQRNTILAGETAYKELHRTEGDVEALWETYRDEALAAVDAWVEAEKQANRDIAQQRIKELGSNFVQSWLRDKKGLSLDRLDKKSLKELNDILAAIGELTDAEVMSLIPDGDKEKAEAVKLIVDDILKKIKEARDEQEEIVDAKKWEKIEKSLSSLASAAKSLGDALSDLGGAGEVLGDAVSSVGEFASSYASIQKSIKEGDTAGIAATAITNIAELISSVADNIEENKKAQEEWELTVLSTDLAYRRLMLDRMDYEESNVFGVESPFAKAKSAVEQYKAAKTELDSIVDELGEGQVQTGTKKEAVSAWGDIGKGAAAGAALGAIIPGVGSAIGAVAGSVVGMIVGAFKRKTVPVYESLKEQYGELYDSETYELNPRIIADYDKLDDKTKEIVDHWDEIKEKMVEAQEAIEETISELAGEMGDELRDFLVEAFRNDDLYSAIDDFHDYVTGVLEDLIAKSVFAAVFEEKFKQLQEDLENSSDIKGEEGNGKTWTDILSGFFTGLSEDIDVFNSLMEQAQEEAKKTGFGLFLPDGNDNSLGGSVSSSITEDTANLLASYLNAMRADVSFIRMTQTEGWLNVKLIAAAMPSPTVWEHIAQIEAHAYNISISNAEIAQSNAAMLSELRSVITTEHGSPAISAAIQ